MIRQATEMAVEIRENMRGGAGAVTLQHLFKADEFKAKSRLCARLTLPPGAGIGPHRHDNEDEVYYILRGEGVVEEDTGARRVKTGDAVLTGQGASHAIRNDGAEPLEILAVILCYA